MFVHIMTSDSQSWNMDTPLEQNPFREAMTRQEMRRSEMATERLFRDGERWRDPNYRQIVGMRYRPQGE